MLRELRPAGATPPAESTNRPVTSSDPATPPPAADQGRPAAAANRISRLWALAAGGAILAAAVLGAACQPGTAANTFCSKVTEGAVGGALLGLAVTLLRLAR